MFVLGHDLFLEALSFPADALSQNYSHLGTDDIRAQISAHIFAQNRGFCLQRSFR